LNLPSPGKVSNQEDNSFVYFVIVTQPNRICCHQHPLRRGSQKRVGLVRPVRIAPKAI
jgi:hypothetical protein